MSLSLSGDYVRIGRKVRIILIHMRMHKYKSHPIKKLIQD